MDLAVRVRKTNCEVWIWAPNWEPWMLIYSHTHVHIYIYILYNYMYLYTLWCHLQPKYLLTNQYQVHRISMDNHTASCCFRVPLSFMVPPNVGSNVRWNNFSSCKFRGFFMCETFLFEPILFKLQGFVSLCWKKLDTSQWWEILRPCSWRSPEHGYPVTRCFPHLRSPLQFLFVKPFGHIDWSTYHP